MSVHQVGIVGGATFPALASASLLESAGRAGITLPSGCRTGACLNCAARLIAGEVVMPFGTALSSDLIAARYFLPCVARPRSDLTIDVGRAFGLLDVPPWTD